MNRVPEDDAEFDDWLTSDDNVVPLPKKDRPPFQNWSDRDISTLPDLEWLIGDDDRPVLLQNALWQTIGKKKNAKTFYSLEQSFCIAFGLPFHGLPVKQGQVVYILAEGGIKRNYRRVQALWFKYEEQMKAKGYTSLEDARKRSKAFILLDQTIALAAINPDDRYSPQMFLKAMADQGVTKPALIVLDTLARSLWQSGGHENDHLTVGPSIQQCDYIRKKLGGATLILVAHIGANNNDRAKGLTDIAGAVDGGTICKETMPNSGVFEFKMMDQRHAEGGYTITGELQKPSDGSPSVVLVSEGSMSPAAKIAKLPKTARAWYNALVSLRKPTVTLAEWLAAGKALNLVMGKDGAAPSDASSVRKAMQRARAVLVEMNAIEINSDGDVTLTPDKMQAPDDFGPGGVDEDARDDFLDEED
jgi:hypothetical protein